MTVPAATPPSGAPGALGSAERQRRGEQLFAAHEAPLRRHVRRRDPALAEDVVAETFATAWRRLDEIPRGFEFPWLCVTADNVLRNQWRSQRRRAALTDALESVSSGSHRDPAEIPVVGDAISGLPERERALLTMTSLEGLTTGEAADRLGIAPGTARNALVGARRQLAARLAALGVVVASLLLAFFWAQSAGSKERRAPEVLAESLRQSSTVHQSATVHNASGLTRHYDIVTDTATGDQQVTLPGGRTALSQDGAPLTLVPKRGEGQRATDRVERRFADDLRALDAASPEQIQELIDAARRAGTQAPGPVIGGKPTTRVTGVIRDRAGRRREVELLVAVDEPVVLRMRTRLAGTRDPWVTVDFDRWQALSRRQAAPGSAPQVGAEGPSPLEAAGGGETAAQVQAPAVDAPALDRSVDPRDPDRDPAPSGQMKPEPTAPNLPPAYGGPTGAVLHTVTERAAVDGVDMQTETWTEIDGGERVRSVTRRFLADRTEVSTSWYTPLISLHTGAGLKDQMPNLNVGCKKVSPYPVVQAKLALTSIREAKAAAAAGETHPAGPAWTGRDGSTVSTVLVQAPVPEAPKYRRDLQVRTDTWTVASEQLVAASSGFSPLPPTRFETWEVLPAGSSGKDLVEPVPDEAIGIVCRPDEGREW